MAQSEKLERILADVPRDLKRRAAAKAALEGRTLKDVLMELLEKWLREPAKE